MSQIEVDKVIPQSGTALQVGESGDTITIPAGATITNNGTANGFGSADTEKVKVSSNDTTAGFLNGKLVAGTNISLTEGNDGGNETLTAALSGTISTSQIGANQVTGAKLNTDVISAQTELATTPADTDEFLVSDAGTLKRIDYSLIKGGGITVADQWRLTADKANIDTPATVFDSNLERIDTTGQGTIGSAMSESSGIFTFPSTGIYSVSAFASFQKNVDRRYCGLNILVTTNNSSYSNIATSWGHIKVVSNDDTYSNVAINSYIDVTDTANVKVKFSADSVNGDAITAIGSTSRNNTCFTFIRLGDT